MIEHLGKVALDYTYYPGEDLYSDGEIEDTLLEIVTNYPETEFNRVIAEKKDWAVLYHLSHVRGNIVEWLPIGKEEAVLEIGSGCGAVTGVLSQKAASVDCIELSRKRSMINASRNRDRDNITIHLGNFEDVEQHMDKKYDWITLIGVFEYGQGYIHSSTPYPDFLRKAASHLKQGGRLVIAIENRLGMKYFAGCTEDHTGVLFDGIEGYRSNPGIRTFSRKELLDLADAAGCTECAFYYPYPDYKLPFSVYSDDYLPGYGDLRTNRNNLDRKRLQLFDEAEAFDGIIRSGLFPEFSNSFQAILRWSTDTADEWMPRTTPLFVKYSNERASDFAIRTEIVETRQNLSPAGKRQVIKSALHQNGQAHIEGIRRHYETLSEIYRDSKIQMNACSVKDEQAFLEYLHGDTLEHVLDELLHQDRITELETLLGEYLSEVKKGFTMNGFEKTPEFIQTFGDVQLPEAMLCASTANIDMVLNNVMLTEDKRKPWTMIDYEWTFDFPVPYDFVVFRILYYYLKGSSSRNRLLSRNWFGKAGITEEQQQIYEKMERYFQDVYLLTGKTARERHKPIRDMYDDISPGSVDMIDLRYQEAKEREAQYVQLYEAADLNFSEERSVKYMPENKTWVEHTFSLHADTKAVRLDPCSAYCILRNVKITWNGAPAGFRTNGILRKDGSIFFATEDPQIVIEGAGELIHKEASDEGALLTVCFERKMISMQEALSGLQTAYTHLSERHRKARADLSYKDQVIREMENTKVWKAYRKIKRC